MQTGFCFFFLLSDSVGSGPCPSHSAQGGLPRGGLPAWPRDTAMGSGSGCTLSAPGPFSASWWPVGFCTHACLMPVSAGGRWRGCCRGRGPRGGGRRALHSCGQQLVLEPGQGDRVSGCRLAWCLASCGPGLALAGQPLRGWRLRSPTHTPSSTDDSGNGGSSLQGP